LYRISNVHAAFSDASRQRVLEWADRTILFLLPPEAELVETWIVSQARTNRSYRVRERRFEVATTIYENSRGWTASLLMTDHDTR
jgi:hypothetical protein